MPSGALSTNQFTRVTPHFYHARSLEHLYQGGAGAVISAIDGDTISLVRDRFIGSGHLGVVDTKARDLVATLGVMTWGQNDPEAASLHRASGNYLAAKVRFALDLAASTRNSIPGAADIKQGPLNPDPDHFVVMPDYSPNTDNPGIETTGRLFADAAATFLNTLREHSALIDQTTAVYLGRPVPDPHGDPQIWTGDPVSVDFHETKDDLFLHNIWKAAHTQIPKDLPNRAEHRPILYLVDFIHDLFRYHYYLNLGTRETRPSKKLRGFLDGLEQRLQEHSMLTKDWEKAIGFWEKSSPKEQPE